MRTLLETGKPEQTYQHNAYVAKTHAAHINCMLRWARFDPARREKAMAFAKASADFLLKELEPAGAPLEGFTATYVGSGQLSGTFPHCKGSGKSLIFMVALFKATSFSVLHSR